jgi:hypothetical protein
VIADWLDLLEHRLADGGEEELAIALVSLGYVAAAGIEIPEEERRAAGRRALLLLAAGGNPARGLDLDGRAVVALAADLRSPERLAAIASGLDELVDQARGLAHVTEVVRALRGDLDVAWRAYAASILADELEIEIGDDGAE